MSGLQESITLTTKVTTLFTEITVTLYSFVQFIDRICAIPCTFTVIAGKGFTLRLSKEIVSLEVERLFPKGISLPLRNASSCSGTSVPRINYSCQNETIDYCMNRYNKEVVKSGFGTTYMLISAGPK